MREPLQGDAGHRHHHGNPPCHCPYCGEVGQPGRVLDAGPDQVRQVRRPQQDHRGGADGPEDAGVRPSSRAGVRHRDQHEGRGAPAPDPPLPEPRLETEVVCDGAPSATPSTGCSPTAPTAASTTLCKSWRRTSNWPGSNSPWRRASRATCPPTWLPTPWRTSSRRSTASGVRSAGSTPPRRRTRPRPKAISFQNLAGAQKNVQAPLRPRPRRRTPARRVGRPCRSFQKRHLLAHRMGIVDEEYLKKTGDTRAKVGREGADRRR